MEGSSTDELQDICTRSLDSGAVYQVLYSCFGIPQPRLVCYGCSMTCHAADVFLPPRLLVPSRIEPSVCNCDPSTCLFAPTFATAQTKTEESLLLAKKSLVLMQTLIGQQRMRDTILTSLSFARGPREAQCREEVKKFLPPSLWDEARACTSLPLSGRDVDREKRALVALMQWVRNNVKWVGAKGENVEHECQNALEPIGACRSSPEEQTSFWSHITELYRCRQCGHHIRFPRVNRAVECVRQRRGRCGEYAQIMESCAWWCGWDTRSVHDTTDHVWVEVLVGGKRKKTQKEIEESGDDGEMGGGVWMHCDTGEDCVHVPLLYEEGWGKHMQYCIALNEECVVDVTPRYTRRWNDVLQRRVWCSEEWLANELKRINQELQLKIADPARRNQIGTSLEQENKLLNDMKTGVIVQPVVEEEKEGRKTGDAEWKQERGEK